MPWHTSLSLDAAARSPHLQLGRFARARGAWQNGPCGKGDSDERRRLRQGQPPASDRRVGLHLPRLSRAAAAHAQVRRAAGRRGRGLLQHDLEIHQRRAGAGCAHPCGGDLRPFLENLPQRDLRRLQGQPPRAARGTAPPVPPDARGDARLQPRLHRDPRLRGRRHHRHAGLPGARTGRDGHDHQFRQGPDAACGRRRGHAGPDQGQVHHPRRGLREVRRLP